MTTINSCLILSKSYFFTFLTVYYIIICNCSIALIAIGRLIALCTFLLAVFNIGFDICSQNFLERNKKVLEFKKDIITNQTLYFIIFDLVKN